MAFRENIMIVEDESLIALELKRRLVNFGYDCSDIVNRGEDALALLDSKQFDLVLMDIHLQGELDGIETAWEIKRKFDVPVVFLTAYSDSSTLRKAKETEPYGYITKGSDPGEVYTTVEIALYKSRLDRKLRKQEKLSSAILDCLGEAIIATDDRLNIIFINRIAEKICGWVKEEVPGVPLYKILRLEKEKNNASFEAFQFPELLEQPFCFKKYYLINRMGERISIDGRYSNFDISDNNLKGRVLTFRKSNED